MMQLVSSTRPDHNTLGFPSLLPLCCPSCSCGSASHKTADCLERPRAKGARWTNKNIAADDKVQEINLPTWDSKRDR
jgi:hypothetical protein